MFIRTKTLLLQQIHLHPCLNCFSNKRAHFIRRGHKLRMRETIVLPWRNCYLKKVTLNAAFCPQVCTSCSPVREYVRLFDVTERTSLHRHGTGRRCSHCGGELRDTIVHFGERGTLEQPLNWKGAAEAAKMADVILCLGSSLKVGFYKPQCGGHRQT